MKLGLKKYFSLFLLGIFLFAYSEKGIHDLLHSDDVHCNSLTEKHYHNAEHHCAICDFQFQWFDNSVAPLKITFVRKAYTANFILPATVILTGEVSHNSSRGPPSLA